MPGSVLFIIGISTDLLDGSVARCLKRETKFGAMLDSIADRILIIPIAIYSLLHGHRWLLLTLLLLEVLNGLVSIYPQAKNKESNSNIFGKVKMVLQSIVFALILITWPKSISLFYADILWLSVVSIILSVFLKILELNFPKLSRPVKL